MSSPDGVLAAIDSALRDYSVSPDAMRSAPDAPADMPDPAIPDFGALMRREWDSPSRSALVTFGFGDREPIRPEDLCPSCGHCRWQTRNQSIHGGQRVGPWVITYACGYIERRWPEIEETWEFESATRTWVDEHGFVMEEPIGWMTFRCGCGHSVYVHADSAIARGREHVSTEHPTWEQIPEQESV